MTAHQTMNRQTTEKIPTQEPSLKLRTARTLKWNTIDRLSSQLLYAITGIVLANLLSKEDFGLVGALLVFQAFGILFVDSGFGSALLQKEKPSREDYSTVFWFNLGVSAAVYGVLFICAPLISDIFQNDRRLIPLSRVMFLSFILNGLCLVQTTRLMKEMNVRQIAIANIMGLLISGGVGVWLALHGAGAWALVWQTVSLSAVKAIWLWSTSHWRPILRFSTDSLHQIWKLGISVFSSSALNTFFLYIYSFIIGAFYSLASLGVYTQADKWSKMGSASISQVLTASFVPLLARFQNDGDNFRRYVSKINRFASFILFPAMAGIATIGQPLFHTLFGFKWDSAIILFQILTFRGIFVVLISLYTNYLLSLGRARLLIVAEIIKDGFVLAAILCTLWDGSIEALVWGQLGASVSTYIIMLAITSRTTQLPGKQFIKDIIPFLLSAAAAAIAGYVVMASIPAMSGNIRIDAAIRMVICLATGLTTYLSAMKISGCKEPDEAFGYAFGRLLCHKRDNKLSE